MIIASLDSTWQALQNNGHATTFGDCDFGSLKTNFPIFGSLHHYSCGGGGYHFKRFQPNWQRVISQSFYGGVP